VPAAVATVTPAWTKGRLLAEASQHPCAQHRLFDALADWQPDAASAAALLKNYDAHAAVLRRLLLSAATLMPEPAVGFVLENVRNEYGNGIYANNHQQQLRDVASACGVTDECWNGARVEAGVRRFIRDAIRYYRPSPEMPGKKAAIAAGAITATELLAISEFRALQVSFAKVGLGTHIWFNHVLIEEEHCDESLMLALYFIEKGFGDSVGIGLQGVLNANVHLYDGLLAAMTK
jgi:hypothetical protein